MIAMAVSQSCHLEPPSHPCRLSASPPSSDTSPPPRSTSHYRPFSTLYTQSPYIQIRDKSLRRRHSSLGGLHPFAHMGMGFMDKTKTKKVPSTVDLQVADPIEIKISIPTQLPPPLHIQRPSTSSGLITPTPTLHRVKKKRSIASLFTATDPSASTTASGSGPPSPGSQYLLSSSQSVDVPMKTNASASTAKKTRFFDQDSNNYDDLSPKFIPKSVWAKRHNMKLHPYHHEVPYMQAYNPILLDSDRYSNLLLQRLAHGSPSFHDYSKKPPATVLDLGCGPGHWVLQTASVWKTSQITGLDLVDLRLPGFETTENAHFVLGNFIAFELPFPDNSFDYVRMANLVLCIPYETWDFVLTQVRRVLTVNGKLELIDDQIFFPYGTAPKPAPRPWYRDMSDALDFDEDQETLQGSGSEAGSTLNVSSEPSNSSCEEKPRQDQIVESPTLRPIPSYRPPTPVESPCPYTGAAFDTESRHVSWHTQATASRELESIFEIMLKQKYRIFPRPSEFVLNRMKHVFGRDAAGKTGSYHIKLAPIDSIDVGSGQGKADGEETKNNHFDGFSIKKRRWMGIDREKALKHGEKKVKKTKLNSKADTSIGSGGGGSSSERSSLENSISVSPSTSTKATGLGVTFSSPLPVQLEQTTPLLSAKAAGQLGISYSDLAAATAALTHQRPGTSSSSLLQTPGLIVWPSTFIPLTPAEVEMHANKYVHTLLGCKSALAEFLTQFTDEDGTKFVDDDEFHEAMWKYECFRRSRFNWPSEIPDLYDDEPTATPFPPISTPPLIRSKSESKSNKSGSDSSYNELDHGEQLTHIRTIRVFEATKLDERSLTSLLFHHKTQPTP